MRSLDQHKRGMPRTPVSCLSRTPSSIRSQMCLSYSFGSLGHMICNMNHLHSVCILYRMPRRNHGRLQRESSLWDKYNILH